MCFVQWIVTQCLQTRWAQTRRTPITQPIIPSICHSHHRYILATHRAEVAALENAAKAATAAARSSHDDGGIDNEGAEWTRRGRSKKRQAWRTAPATESSSSRAEEAKSEAKREEKVLPPPPLEIFEIGGGYGTNALCILEYLKREAPQVYVQTRYRIVEISGCVGVVVVVLACVVLFPACMPKTNEANSTQTIVAQHNQPPGGQAARAALATPRGGLRDRESGRPGLGAGAEPGGE